MIVLYVTEINNIQITAPSYLITTNYSPIFTIPDASLIDVTSEISVTSGSFTNTVIYM